MKEKIKYNLAGLVGLKLQYAGRASNLFWLGFGDMVTVVRRGEPEELAEHALHIQCSWRITKGNKILVASRDFYTPSSEWTGDNENFDWDIQGNNRFDERIKAFIQEVKGRLFVEKIDSDEVGGLKIFLSESHELEAFPDSSEDHEYSEYWRFFTRTDVGPHFVVTGSGIEME